MSQKVQDIETRGGVQTKGVPHQSLGQDCVSLFSFTQPLPNPPGPNQGYFLLKLGCHCHCFRGVNSGLELKLN